MVVYVLKYKLSRWGP